MNESLLLPALLLLAVLSALRARVNAYDAFVRGAKEGLATAVEIAPYLAAVLTAVALLRETGLCTYEIAERIGFVDPHYFSVSFRRRTSMTPREYREANR